jgi:hypothetical protein
MYLAFIDIDMVKQVLIHESDVALGGIGLHGIVLVEVKGDDILKGQPFLRCRRTSSAYTL